MSYAYYIQNVTTLEVRMVEEDVERKVGDILPPLDDSGCFWRVMTVVPDHVDA